MSNNVISRPYLSKGLDSSVDIFSLKIDQKNEVLSLNNSKINENPQEKDRNKSILDLDNNKETIFNKIDHVKKSQGGELKINYCDIIALMICPCCKRKYARIQILLNKSREEVSKYLNFLDIIKMLQEFSKLKLALMNSDQINIFSYASRPIISRDENLIDTYMNRYELNNEKLTVHQLYESFVALNKENDIMSNRLIELFDEDYKSAFDYLMQQEKINNK